MSDGDEFANLRQLHGNVDGKFAQIAGRHPMHVTCKLGCHGCCLPGLTVSQVEAAQIAAYFGEQPAALAKARELAETRPHGKERCDFLDETGACVIYPVRPSLCRSHGVPAWQAKDDGTEVWDVCPLNFAGVDLRQLPEDRIALQTVNTTLYVVGELWRRGSARKRVRLTLRGLGIGRKA